MNAGLEAIDLRSRRIAAGLTQRQLAERAEVPQPNIAAYETGRRRPTPATLSKLDAVLHIPTLRRLQAVREEILRAAESRHLTNVRVFGSVVRNTATAQSDVDLLVHPSPEASVFDLAGFMSEVEDLLGVRVDVVSDRGSGPAMERIRSEALAL